MLVSRSCRRRNVPFSNAFQLLSQARRQGECERLLPLPLRITSNHSRLGSTNTGRFHSDVPTSSLLVSHVGTDQNTGLDAISHVILRDLNPSQVEAVTQPLDAITRVIAGPGSGKTRVLTCRIAHILKADHRSHILGVTFTRKAAGEMKERLEKLLLELSQGKGGAKPTTTDPEAHIIEEYHAGEAPRVDGLDRVTLGTFHSICSKILRWNGELLSTLPSVARDMAASENFTMLEGSFNIADEGDQLRILKQCLDEKEIDLKSFGLRPRPVLSAIAQIKAMFAEERDPLAADNSFKRSSMAMRIAVQVFKLYREKLLTTNSIDFDDLIYMTRELLMEHPDVRERLRQRWGHILVDEFQDTSKAQLELVKLLTSSSLFIVGDADQSIYSWRGAHAGSLSDFENEFQDLDRGVQTVYLMENYR